MHIDVKPCHQIDFWCVLKNFNKNNKVCRQTDVVLSVNHYACVWWFTENKNGYILEWDCIQLYKYWDIICTPVVIALGSVGYLGQFKKKKSSPF